MISRWSRRISLVLGLATAGVWACSPGGTQATGGAAGAAGSPASTSSSSSTTSSGATGPSNVGLACASTADCGAGLSCVLPTANDSTWGGGPAGGYCSTSCASNLDCPADAQCFRTGSNTDGNCVLTCTPGPALGSFDDALSPTKCRGREDLRCTTGASGKHICIPTCSSDGQCPAGRVCDPRTSVCVDQAHTGLPTGSLCDPQAVVPECAGVCVLFTGTTVATCSQDCVLGGDPAHPTASPSCGGVAQGLCIYRPTGNGAGDYGYCAPACTHQDDCGNPGLWCLPTAGLTGDAGVPNGYCRFGTACPNGDADCAAVPTSTCTATKYGPICLTADFPLGSAAPDDGGAEGGMDDAGLDDAGSDAGADAGGDAGDGG